MNVLLELSTTVQAYIYSFVSTDSYNMKAMRLMSQYEQIAVGLQQCQTRFTAWLGKLGSDLDAAWRSWTRAFPLTNITCAMRLNRAVT